MSKSKQLCLVYVEHPMCSMDCADAVVDLLNSSGRYIAELVGPGSFPYKILSEKSLAEAVCLVVPGGYGDSDQYDKSLLAKNAEVIKKYISSGGKYLGICMGSYLAGHHYMNIMHKSTKCVQYVKRKKSTIDHEKQDVVDLVWEGDERSVYFHDGAAFVPRKGHARIAGEAVAYYINGDVAALIQKKGKGRVGVIGPHPEAAKWWFYCQDGIKKRWRDCIQHDLLLGFFEKLLV